MKATKILIVLIVLSSIHLTAQLTSFQRVEYDNVKGKYIVYADALDGTPDKVFWNDYYKSSNLKLKQFDIFFHLFHLNYWVMARTYNLRH